MTRHATGPDRAYGTRLSGTERATYVNDMFGRIARRYDLINRLMTFGMDITWRREVVAATHLPATGSVLDVATGTGDIAFALAVAFPQASVVGIDFVPAMIERANTRLTHWAAARKGAGHAPHFMVADALHLPFDDNQFDCVTTGFAMRNVSDIRRAFAEMLRVTRPGGRVVCLEITHTTHPLMKHLFTLYFYRLIPLVGGIISGDREAYTYLPHSLTNFPDAATLATIMADLGWTSVSFRRLNLGTVALHIGVKSL